MEVVEVTVEDVVDGFTEVELDFTVVDVDVELGFTVVDDVEVGFVLPGLPWPQEKQPVVQSSWNMPMTVFSCT